MISERIHHPMRRVDRRDAYELEWRRDAERNAAGPSCWPVVLMLVVMGVVALVLSIAAPDAFAPTLEQF